MTYIPKLTDSTTATTTNQNKVSTEEHTYKTSGGTTLSLFNNLTYIFTSKKFRNEQDEAIMTTSCEQSVTQCTTQL